MQSNRRVVLGLAMLCLSNHLSGAQADPQAEESLRFQLLPQGRVFRSSFADPREIKMALQLDDGSHLTASIGNYFSILGWADALGYRKVAFGIEGAGYFGLRQADHRFPLETADGLIGLYAEGSYGGWQTQMRYTHISAHLADGSSGQAIPYSREFVELREGLVPWREAFFYAGASALVNSVPALPPWGIQAGGNLFLPIFSRTLTPFAAVDLKWKQESPANPSLNVQLGFALNDIQAAYRSFRLFYSYYTGQDPRGQFYYQTYTSYSVGLEMQI